MRGLDEEAAFDKYSTERDQNKKDAVKGIHVQKNVNKSSELRRLIFKKMKRELLDLLPP